MRRDQRLEQRITGEGVLLSLPVQGTEIKLPSGLLTGQEVHNLLINLTWPFHDLDSLTALPIPFTAIATNLRTGEATPLTGVPLPLAIRASMSLPTIFTPVQIDGELYIDGGLARNIPAEDALDLGADFLIGVDVGDMIDSVAADSPSFIDVFMDAYLYQGVRSDREQRQLLDVLIRPDTEALSPTSFDQADAWIERGEVATRAALPELRRLLKHRVHKTKTPGSFQLSSASIDRIEIVGPTPHGIRLVESRLNLQVPAILGPNDIAPAIQRVFGTGLFELVTYNVYQDTDSTSVLRVEARPEENPDRLGFGYRYDSFYKSELLFSLALKNRLRFGSTTEIRTLLGNQNQVEGRYLTRMGIDARLTLGGRLAYSSAPIQLFLPDAFARTTETSPNIPILGLRFDVYSATLIGGFTYDAGILAGVQINAEYTQVKQEVAGSIPSLDGPDQELDVNDQSILTTGFLLGADTFDQVDFPTRGYRALAEIEVGLSDAQPPLADSTETYGSFFRHAYLDIEGYLPLLRGFFPFRPSGIGIRRRRCTPDYLLQLPGRSLYNYGSVWRTPAPLWP